MILSLTKRDEAVLSTLSLKVHLASLSQIAAEWWGESSAPERAARARLRQLENAGWLLRKRVNIHPLLSLEEPILVWSPSKAEPNFGAVSYQLRKRWTMPLQLTTAFIASRKTANQYGGFGGKFKHRTQLTHDLHLAELYFAMIAEDAGVSKRWSGEEERASDGEKLPDAVLLNESGEVDEVIEFGGQYDRRRVEEFHRYCKVKGFRYQLW